MSLALFKRSCGFFAYNSYGREGIGIDLVQVWICSQLSLHLRARFDSLWITVAKEFK